MASLFRDGQKPPQKVLEIIIDFFRKVPHPVYLGYISLEIGWSLARTKEMLDLLESRGNVRPLTVEEKKLQGYPEEAIVYMMCR